MKLICDRKIIGLIEPIVKVYINSYFNFVFLYTMMDAVRGNTSKCKSFTRFDFM